MSSAVETARQQLSSGRVGEAETTLRSAGDAGDAVALAELAVWHLRGEALPRDLAAAREYLRCARTIGHVDAALMEIALTANGSGGTPHWKAAMALLERAARTDPVAAQQLALLRAMSIDVQGQPTSLPEPELLQERPQIKKYCGFCTALEGAYLASLVAQSLEPATVIDPVTGRLVAHPIRTSDTATIGPVLESLVVQAINHRIAAATGTQVAQGEPLTVLRYAPGQQYRPHLDTLPGETNQRIRTAILYLNSGYEGGETSFPLVEVTVRAGLGDLVVFDNVDETGAPDPLSRHAGLPVIRGNKWIATRWIRADPISPWELSDRARAATRAG